MKKQPSWTKAEIAEAHSRIKADSGQQTISHEKAKAEINRVFEELRCKYSNSNDNETPGTTTD